MARLSNHPADGKDIDNSKYMGGLLSRDLGVCFISADTDEVSVDRLVVQIKEPSLTFLNSDKS